jgi:Family of unknown function (DUF6494)
MPILLGKITADGGSKIFGFPSCRDRHARDASFALCVTWRAAWCGRSESNRHSFWERHFECRASTSSATPAQQVLLDGSRTSGQEKIFALGERPPAFRRGGGRRRNPHGRCALARFHRLQATGKMAANAPFSRREPMNEEVLNTSLRKFLKTVGVTSQREIEKAIRAGVADGRLRGNEALAAQMVLTIDKVGLSFKVDGTIELE